MTESAQRFIFRFAGFTCVVEAEPQHYEYLLKCYEKSPFSDFIQRETVGVKVDATLVLKVSGTAQDTTHRFSFKQQYSTMKFVGSCAENVFFLMPVVEQMLRRIFYILFFKHDGFIVHSSGAIYKKGAFLFTGPSGAGKSTMAKLLIQTPGFSIFADNNIFIRKIDDQFYTYRSPFLEWNVTPLKSLTADEKYSIKKVCILEKGTENTLSSVALNDRIAHIARQIQLPLSALTESEKARARQLVFEFITSSNVAVEKVTFQKDPSVAQLFI